MSQCENRIFDANSHLKEISRQRGGIIIGTTVAVLLAFDGYFACMWSGDSRIYIIREGKISQISRDHTEVQDLLMSGVITPEQAETWSGSNAITRAIGVVDLPELEVTSGALNAGDVFVMCTDGLTQHVEDDEILRCVSTSMSQPACDRLIQLTLERGAVDNVTVVVARYIPRECATFGCRRVCTCCSGVARMVRTVRKRISRGLDCLRARDSMEFMRSISPSDLAEWEKFIRATWSKPAIR